MFGIPLRSIFIGLIVLALLGGGAWIMHEKNKADQLTKENAEIKEAIVQYRLQEKQAIDIVQKKQVYTNKASKTKEKVNEEVSKPEYSVDLPPASRLLIKSAISEANSYISSSNEMPSN